MKLTSRVLLLADAAARFWIAHWLLIVGSVLIFASASLKWVYFAFSRHPLGLQLPLLGNIGLIPHLSLLSYGVVGIAVLTMALVLVWRSATYLALVAAAVLVALWMTAPCQIAFQQPALLSRLVAETQELSMIRDFTKTYLPTDYGPLKSIRGGLSLTPFGTAFSLRLLFLGLGWYCFGIGSLLIAIYLVARLPAEERIRVRGNGRNSSGRSYHSADAVAHRAALFYRVPALRRLKVPGKRQSHLIAGRCGLIGGAPGTSISYAAIGDLERLSNLSKDSPEQHISKAREFKEAREYELAVFELARAADCGGAVASVARRESARTRVEFALALYRGGGIGAAVTQWEQALVEDPMQQQGLTFLIARGNYDLGRYQASLDVLKDVLQASADRPTRANAYSLAGDCYAKLGRDAEARTSYKRSLKEDMLVNFWGMSRLTGN